MNENKSSDRLLMLPVGAVFTFHSPYQQCAALVGEQAQVVGHITEANDEIDEESLPMYVIRFADGTTIEAWPEEVE